SRAVRGPAGTHGWPDMLLPACNTGNGNCSDRSPKCAGPPTHDRARPAVLPKPAMRVAFPVSSSGVRTHRMRRVQRVAAVRLGNLEAALAQGLRVRFAAVVIEQQLPA